MMRETLAFISNLNTTIHYSFSFVHICTMHACGVWVVFLEHGALGICKSSVCTYSWTSARFIHIVFHYFLENERSGRKPPAERSALYLLQIATSAPLRGSRWKEALGILIPSRELKPLLSVECCCRSVLSPVRCWNHGRMLLCFKRRPLMLFASLLP